ncbi:AMP-binding protein [Desulfurivibrio alkaliphilus]|uniref:AMP-dependent synthetase and ligase n=1 Tax=Desulfurivibrio alkaliphilus (strain DSM 19089 / UNIQEM U267 / AHT2) TaxID=589865 RepID=D6Z5S3_DESAT|nr:AMP-binding protein [Desulfurivibrio alkaliphilus]ADH86810.1 AMP-dependent synthetase and ligase [Desulfurivibrio alkaliphilus AHT 2]
MSKQYDTLSEMLDYLAGYGEQQALILVEAESTRLWSYQRLSERVDEVAGALLAMGLEPGGLVGLLGENRPEWIIAALAVLRAGGVLLPLDAQLDDDGLAHVAADSGARYFFVGTGQESRFAKINQNNSSAPAELKLLPLNDLPTGSPPAAFPKRRPEDPAAMFYTSGTTGPPKGVPLTHANLAFQLNTVAAAGLVTARDRVLLPLPLHHVYPLVVGLLTPLALGLPLIMPDVLTGPRILRAVKAGRATALIGVPRLYQALYQGVEDKVADGGAAARLYFRTALGLSAWCKRRLGLRAGKMLLAPLHRRFGSSLRLLASGGSALDPELARRLEALGWQVAIGYGLTETAPLLTINPPVGGRPGSVGRAVPGVELRLEPLAEDSSESSDAPPMGEVLARGPNVFAGYHNLPEQTAAALKEGWFRTGDLGYLDRDGFLFLVGRASSLIVTAGGKNIQPDALEDRLTTHPFIREAGVLSRDDRLAVLLVPELAALRRAGQQDEEAALRQALLEVSHRLPSYQRPDEFALSREALPRTRLGKIRRHLLPGRYQQARAQQHHADKTGPMPLNEMSDHDRALLENRSASRVWEWLARRYPKVRLSPDTSPHLDLGVDSLGWLNLAAEIGQQADVQLTEEVIGRVETVRDLLHEVVELSVHGNGGGQEGGVADPLADPEAVLKEQSRRWLKPLNPLQVALVWGLYQLNRLLFRLLFRLRVEGLEHLPDDKPFILAPNHVSFLDSFAIGAALPFARFRQTYYAGNAEVAFRNAFFRLVCRLGQVVPIDPRRATATSLAYGAVILDQGCNLVWFPEGERSWEGRLQPFRAGIGMLLDRKRVYVVPAHIAGAYQAWPRGRKLFRPHPISIKFGPALTAQQLLAGRQGGGEASANDRSGMIAAALREQVAALAPESDES